MNVAAIMPCRGRNEQTLRNVKRLLSTAGMDDWDLWCVCDHDEPLYLALAEAVNAKQISSERFRFRHMWSTHTERGGYWRAMHYATEQTDAPFLIGLANDLLPGHQWLRRAVEAYRAEFGSGDGVIGFNDGIHEVGHSTHFLISRSLLERFGGWPVWYGHNFGDSELVTRATDLGLYAKAPWAVLYHDHWINGGKPDAVYAEGEASSERDRRLFEQRRAAGWPSVSR